ENAVAANRSAQRSTKLVEVEGRLLRTGQVIEEGVRICIAVAKVFIRFAVELIRSTLGGHGHGRGAVSKLRVGAGNMDLYFLDRRRRMLHRDLAICGALDVDPINGDVAR